MQHNHHLNKVAFRQKAPLHLSPAVDVPLAQGGETQSKRRWKGQVNTFLLCCILYWRQEYPSFYCTLIYYIETGDKASRASVSVCVCRPQSSTPTPRARLAVRPAQMPLGCDILHMYAKHTPHRDMSTSIFILKVVALSLHLHAYLCPCCVMSIALLAGTGEPPSVTLRTSMDFLSGLLLPWRFNMGESTRFLGGSVPNKGDTSIKNEHNTPDVSAR